MKKILTLLTVTILFLTYALVSQENTGTFLDLKQLKNNEITTDNKSQVIDRSAYKDKEKFHEMMKTALKNRKSVIFKNEAGVIYTNGEYRFHLQPEENSASVAYIEYQIDGGPFSTYSNPIPLEKEGVYKLTYRSTDVLGIVEKPQTYTINVDTKAPEVKASLVGEGTKPGDIQYYKPGVKLTAQATDAGAGVNLVIVNVNGEGNLPLTEDLTFTKGGDYEIAVRALDNVYNLSKKTMLTFSIDDKKPTVSVKSDPKPVMINNITFCKKDSFIVADANDPESGIAKIEYSLNAPGDWKEYKPATLRVTESDVYKIYFRATDVSGNMSDTVEFSCRVDFKPPQSKHNILYPNSDASGKKVEPKSDSAK
ncbi:MAG TPA: hypothetical protein PK079_21845 [Leptospiraceae bacterium]|nr:hypothetical protein [Leptospiraceae bacterium]HMX31166.1 hypothetical protein [Leptospiraceae bacterium]HMY30694.1 hypothetical protein [Leptospiraceae bacterium]HMZ63237.1 hypothetical protein [Leptospiraceae bacterium]HNA06241.1 hypothetical protein [Leptospiraceae bacterium]